VLPPSHNARWGAPKRSRPLVEHQSLRLLGGQPEFRDGRGARRLLIWRADRAKYLRMRRAVQRFAGFSCCLASLEYNARA
jgi:hypothetical protein